MVEVWTTWKIVKLLSVFGALLLLVLSLAMRWRMRGMLNWKRSLRREFKALKTVASVAAEARREALAVVVDACQRVWQTTTPTMGELADLRGYVRSIAACFNPQSDQPELCITVGRSLTALQEVADRLEAILQRPGSKRLGRVRIRHFRQTVEWYGRFSRKRVVRIILRYRKAIRRFYQLYLVVLPDPLSWVVYFSNRLTILQLSRYLLLDITLFIGKLAVDAYDASRKSERPVSALEVEQTLEALDAMAPLEEFYSDEQIREIRNRLVGFGPFLRSPSILKEWWAAVMESARVIAGRHFPDAENPLEEAAAGPLLRRCQVWLGRLGEVEAFPVMKYLFGVRVDTLYAMKPLGDFVLSERFLEAAKKGWQAYRWMRWPLRIYRWLKKISPLRVTTAAGVFLIRKGVLNYLARYTFDGACRELEILYRQSRDPH